MSITSKRLRVAREKMNLKQVQVAERIGINNKTLSGYENGVSDPDFETLKSLAKLYEVTTDWLLGHVDDSQDKKINNLYKNEEVRELMEIYRTLDESEKKIFIEVAKKFKKADD